jgi:quercetin dioxygenase-like cupin family protein
VQSWDLREIELSGGTRSPVVVFSREEARAVLIGLDAGQELGDHQVKETAFLVVLDGSIEVTTDDGETLDATAGTLVAFEPNERRRVASPSAARILLVLAPWPAAGHYTAEEGGPGAQAPPAA